MLQKRKLHFRDVPRLAQGVEATLIFPKCKQLKGLLYKAQFALKKQNLWPEFQITKEISHCLN